MSTFKKCKVVMLPTDEKSKLYLTHFGGEKLHYNNTPDNKEIDYQHLYILSDEEIKEDEKWIDLSDNRIFNVTEEDVIVCNKDGYDKNIFKKIIATTDTSLLLDFNKEGDGGFINFPQPSPQFIEKYIESYNSGNIITEVMVEYEEIRKSDGFSEGVFGIRLKINPEDNTITISKCKDSWSREERNEDVIKALLSNDLIHSREEALQWIEENL